VGILLRHYGNHRVYSVGLFVGDRDKRVSISESSA